MISCVDETFNCPAPKDGYIIFSGIHTRAFDPSDPTHPGDIPDDYLIDRFRVLVFETTGSRACKDNVLYSGAAVAKTMSHPIEKGTYDFVFLANEPPHIDIKSQLDNIQEYDDLRKIAYPENLFTSDQLIPMIAQDNNIVILAKGKFKVGSGGTEQEELEVDMRRLAVRLDITLLSEMPLENAEDPTQNIFKGITLSKLPDKIPLIWGLPSDRLASDAEYADPNLTFEDEGTPVEWDLDQKRTFTLDSGDFGSVSSTPDSKEQEMGYKWKRTLNRVILPSSFFIPKDNKNNAVILTVNTSEDKYSPSGELMIKDDDYTLPANAKLDITGIVKEPLELNIIASKWDTIKNNWETDQIYLNLSSTEVNITDFNGARITFESNAPVIRVEGYTDSSGKITWSGNLFNQLEWPDDWSSKIKYTYDNITQIGSGYMDIIVNNQYETAGTYNLILAARRHESWEAGGLILSRHIKVNVKQEGKRQGFDVATDENPYNGNSYIGAFYKNKQVGERIIQNVFTGGWWEATVPDESIDSENLRNWILISSTPSFDPNVGTGNPGNAEDYPVVPNYYKNEDGTKVVGNGRLYFRVGLKSENTGSPRYGYVNLRYIFGVLRQSPPDENATEVTVAFNPDSLDDKRTKQETIKTMKIYVRQGEEPDEILTAGTPIPGESISRDANAIVKFSPYNVTVRGMLANDNLTKDFLQADNSENGNLTDVDFPTQAGALFQWGAPTPAYRLYAYYPRSRDDNEFVNIGPLPNSVWSTHFQYPDDPFWDGPSASTLPPFKDLVEICPPGYRRPNNGALTTLAKNSKIADVVKSEFMASLFYEIPVGDGHKNIPTSYPDDPDAPNGIVRYTPKSMTNVKSGFYADGFFDRYPIRDNYDKYGLSEEELPRRAFGVCIDDARAAYKGTLFFNPDTYASIFFPNSGRRDSHLGYLQYRGASGYYISASLGNQWTPENEDHDFTTFWQIELSYEPAPVSAVLNFASSMRCVEK